MTWSSPFQQLVRRATRTHDVRTTQAELVFRRPNPRRERLRLGSLEDQFNVAGPAGAGRGRREDLEQPPAFLGVVTDDLLIVFFRRVRAHPRPSRRARSPIVQTTSVTRK